MCLLYPDLTHRIAAHLLIRCVQLIEVRYALDKRSCDGDDSHRVDVPRCGHARIPSPDGTRTSEAAPGGLIVAPFPLVATNRDWLIALASDLHLPAIYPFRYFATNGGLPSYGFDPVELHRQAASYVDRILKGEKPSNLPVQAPTRYELVIDLKTAKTLGLSVPPSLLARADEVIE